MLEFIGHLLLEVVIHVVVEGFRLIYQLIRRGLTLVHRLVTRRTSRALP